MVAETKYYDLLGVEPSVSDSELKKAYRKKAMQLHPDKNPDTADLFKEVSHAYETLSDPQKRDMYDQLGEKGLSGDGGMGGGMDPQDLFSHLFGGGMFGGGGGRSRPSGPRKGKDLVHRVKCSLEDLYKGKMTKLALQKSVLCSKCEGRGGKEGAVKTCSTCRGQGVKVVLRQLGPMVQQIQQPCTDCNGEGQQINPKDKCKACNGAKVTKERKVLEVAVDRGMRDGQTITFNGEADQAPNTVPGDVIIVIEEKEHEVFKRKGNDLIMEQKIDLLTALAGGAFPIPHLDDKLFKVNIVPGEIIRPNAVKCIHHGGMPSHRFHQLGDLYVNFTVEFPEHLPESAFPLLEKALPPRAEHQYKHEHVEETVLADVDQSKQARAMDMDEDEDDEEGPGGGGPGVACAQS